MTVQKKIALVTGGSRGLGKNMAIELAKDGHDVVLTYRSKKEEAQQVVADIQALGGKAAMLHLDVNDTASLDGFIQALSGVLQAHWGATHLDFLINNAGIDSHSLFADTTEASFDALMNVHFKGVYFLTQKLLPLLADNGRIVNLSTGLARFAIPGYAAYGAMKSAIETLTRYLAKELGSRGITVNVVAPGPVETDFTKGAFEANPHIKDYLATQTALGRVGVPDDIGGIVAFLCSERARWITAQRIEASGGIFL